MFVKDYKHVVAFRIISRQWDNEGVWNVINLNCLDYSSFSTIMVQVWYQPHVPSHAISVHYKDVIMNTTASEITIVTIVYSTVDSGANQIKHQISVSLVFVWEIPWWPVNSPHKGPVMRKMFANEDVIMK